VKKESTQPAAYRDDPRVRFAETREAVNRTARTVLSQELGFSIKISVISDQAALQAHNWQYHGTRVEHRPRWSWPAEVARYRRIARRIEAAFYTEDGLWGLFLGRISNARVVASIHYLERNPSQGRTVHFVGAALRYLELYAVAARCNTYAVNNPHPDWSPTIRARV
jgi:hypothetical protein